MSPALTLLLMSVPVWLAVVLACWPSRERRAHGKRIREARRDRERSKCF